MKLVIASDEAYPVFILSDDENVYGDVVELPDAEAEALLRDYREAAAADNKVQARLRELCGWDRR